MKNIVLIYSMILIFIFPFITGCEGLEDDDPLTDPREAFVGNWNCDDQLATKRDTYLVRIEASQETNSGVFLYNFGAISNTAAASGSVSGNDISVPFQNLAQGWSCNGSGTMVSQDEIEWTYTLENGSDRYDFVAVFTK